MTNRRTGRMVLAMALLAATGLAVGCESDIDREMRLEREALEESGELEELEQQLNTVNPDPYDPEKNTSRFRGGHNKR